MILRVLHWIAAALAIAATGLAVGFVAITPANSGHVHTIAGIIFNSID